VRLALIGGGLLLAGAAAVLLGVLPADEALALGGRVWPVLLFAAAVTVVAELAAALACSRRRPNGCRASVEGAAGCSGRSAPCWRWW